MCGELGLDEIPLVPVLLSSGQRVSADRGGFGSPVFCECPVEVSRRWLWWKGEGFPARTCLGCVRVYVRRTGSGRDSFGSGVVEFGAAGSVRIVVVLVLRRVVSVRWRCLAGGCGGKVKEFDRDDVRG
ncbi:hypothetical protein Drorol1_Dr00021607 [Drosera rotundifolia]